MSAEIIPHSSAPVQPVHVAGYIEELGHVDSLYPSYFSKENRVDDDVGSLCKFDRRWQ